MQAECSSLRQGSSRGERVHVRASAVNASLHLTYMTRDSAVAQRRQEFTAVRCSTDRRFSSPFTASSTIKPIMHGDRLCEAKRFSFFLYRYMYTQSMTRIARSQWMVSEFKREIGRCLFSQPRLPMFPKKYYLYSFFFIKDCSQMFLNRLFLVPSSAQNFFESRVP